MATQDHSEAHGIGLAELIKWRINQWHTKGKHLLKILVAGKVGVGKSALVNGLIGQEVAPEGDTVASVTRNVNKYEKHINGVDVIVFDTPGLLDPKSNCDRETLHEISLKTEGTVDLLLVCLKMTERIDTTHIMIIQKLKEIFRTDAVWKNTLLVLTFANEVCLPSTRCRIGIPPQPEGQETQLKDYFEKKLSEFRTLLPEYLLGHIDIPDHLLNKIPVIPAGYDHPNLPGCNDWLSRFWAKAFIGVSEGTQRLLLRISEGRFIENPTVAIVPPHLHPISMHVTCGAVLGATLGSAIGSIKGKVLRDSEIEDTRLECHKKGASLGAKFVLYLYDYHELAVDWLLGQISSQHL